MTDTMMAVISVLVFLGVVLLVQVAGSVLGAGQDKRSRVNRRMQLLNSGLSHKEVYESLVRNDAPSWLSAAGLERAYAKIDVYCRQAGLQVTPVKLVGAAAAGGVVLSLAGLVLRSAAPSSVPFLSGVLTIIGAFALSSIAVYAWVSGARTRRMKKLEEQLPLALDIIVRAIRAGHPVVSAVQLVTREMPDPIGSEFGLVVDETTYGLEFKEALTNLARRTGQQDAHFFAVSVGIQSETGGNLAEILSNLATVIRSRFTLQKKIKALASEGKASAGILSVLPIFLIGSIMMTTPDFYAERMDDPIFWPVIIGVAILYCIGVLLIRAITKISY